MDSSSPDSPTLLQRVARGEADAVRDCLARYSPLVWTLAQKLLRERGALEDVVQEIFIELWRSAASFDPEKASEATFVAVVARRRIIDRLRSAARRPALSDVEQAELGRDDAGLAQVDLGDEARRAREALGRASAEERRAILLSVVQGCTHTEIAALTGLPLGTVKSHIRRGLEKVAQSLRGREGARVR
jgi:RNA polymerase sigma-70 factor (ECF subfamily)